MNVSSSNPEVFAASDDRFLRNSFGYSLYWYPRMNTSVAIAAQSLERRIFLAPTVRFLEIA